MPAVLALALSTALGVVDEVLQLAIPSRVFDLEDIATNFLSAAMALAAKLSLNWARDRHVSRRSKWE